MDKGQIVELGSPLQLFDNIVNPDLLSAKVTFRQLCLTSNIQREDIIKAQDGSNRRKIRLHT